MRNFFQSTGFAAKGLRYAWKTERNFRLQLAGFVLVLVAAVLLRISKIELLIILLVSAVILALELINTAIERLADRVAPEHDAHIGIVKDLMAGAVLLASCFAIIMGLLIFFAPLKAMLHF